ncbi:MAG: fimbrillin family protein [Tannerellaceae bacterium]|nr:fimbrillin family protein [Tannerellaceae bacterium]
MITSCSNDTKETVIDPNQRVAVEINTGLETRASNATWDRGDKIGITMYDPTYTTILEDQFNRDYINSARLTTFTPVDEQEVVYFPQDGSDMRLKAYYPYIADLPANMIVRWSVADQDPLSAIDLMTAEHVSGFNSQSDIVYLHFYHRLSKLIFILDTEEDTAGVTLADCQLTITGMNTANNYDLFNNQLGTNPTAGDISVPLRADEADNQREAIVFPRPAGGEEVHFRFTTPDGSIYTAIMSPELELEEGKQYIFYIVLARNPTIVYADIEDWKTGGTDTITAR